MGVVIIVVETLRTQLRVRVYRLISDFKHPAADAIFNQYNAIEETKGT
jgi:hypothetical protein